MTNYHDHSGERHAAEQRYDEREQQLTDADFLALFAESLTVLEEDDEQEDEDSQEA